MNRACSRRRARNFGRLPEELAAALAVIKAATFNVNLVPGILIIFVKSVLLAALTLFISTFATSSLFTIMIAAAVYFIGHLQSTAREYWLQGADIKWWTRLIVALIALLFPDLQSFNLTDDVIAGAPIPSTRSRNIRLGLDIHRCLFCPFRPGLCRAGAMIR